MPAALWTGRDADPDRVTADLTLALGRELGLDRPPVAATLPPDSTGVPAGSLLPPRERFSGMPAPTLCYVYVDAQAPRPFELRASLMAGRAALRRSLGLGQLLYAVPLSRPLPCRVALSAPRRFGPSSFEGDAEAAGRLNADRELVAEANALTPWKQGRTPRTPGRSNGCWRSSHCPRGRSSSCAPSTVPPPVAGRSAPMSC